MISPLKVSGIAMNYTKANLTERKRKKIFMLCKGLSHFEALLNQEQRNFMQVWPNFISVTVRNIICVWVCRELQPLLGPLLMRPCHSRVSSLKADVVSKSASQQINQSFSPKHQETLGWEETLLIDGFIKGIAVQWKVAKTDTLLKR